MRMLRTLVASATRDPRLSRIRDRKVRVSCTSLAAERRWRPVDQRTVTFAFFMPKAIDAAGARNVQRKTEIF
jgi:hypothetical protein